MTLPLNLLLIKNNRNCHKNMISEGFICFLSFYIVILHKYAKLYLSKTEKV